MLRDFWPWGLISLVLLAMSTVLLFTTTPIGLVAVAWFSAGMALVLGYGRIVRLRWVLRRDVRAATRQRVFILKSAYSPQAADVEAEVQRTINLWNAVPGADALLQIKDTFVMFLPYPFKIDWLPDTELAGHTIRDFRGLRGTFCILVGYKEIMADTALGHELGHVVMLKWQDNPSEEALRVIATAHGVPY